MNEYPHNGTDTSVTASRVNGTVRQSQRQRILELFTVNESGLDTGFTDEELMDRLGLTGNSLHPRRWQLVKDEVLYDSGERRPTRNGLPAIVWRIRRERSAA
jgi:hypothetical protein